MTIRRAAGFACVLVSVLGPFLVGVVPIRTLPSAALVSLTLVLALHAMIRRPTGVAARVVLAISVGGLTVTSLDLALRRPLAWLLPYRLDATFPTGMESMQTYARASRRTRTIAGDLAAMAPEHPEYREWRRVTFETDARGFRNTPSRRPAGTTAVDVILLGDSVGAGDATDQPLTWASLLKRRYGLETYNLSVARTGPWHEYVRLGLEVDRLDGNPAGTIVVWAWFSGNDLDDVCFPGLDVDDVRKSAGPGGLIAALQSFRQDSPIHHLLDFIGTVIMSGPEEPLPRVLAKTFLDGRPLLFFRPHVEIAGRDVAEVRAHPNFPCLMATAQAMARLARARRLTVVMVAVPSKEEVYSWLLRGDPPWSSPDGASAFSGMVREIAAREGFGFLDLRPVLVRRSRIVFEQRGELLWWRDDTHWNARGHEEATAAVYEGALRPILAQRRVRAP